MPTSTATPSFGGTFQRAIQLNVTASNDTQTIVIPHGISFADGTATVALPPYAA